MVPALSLILGAAIAQSGGAGSTSSGSSQKNPSTTSGSTSSRPTSATGSGYQSGTASADADAARDINSQTRANNKLAWGDRRFVTKAADSGQMEVHLAQLAVQRASNAEVRSYAQKLVDDHTMVNSELTTLAMQKSLTLDKDDSKDRIYNRLSKKSGAEFDQEFVEHMIDEHEKDVKLFDKASTDAKDSELRAFASKHVGHLREHLQQAESLRQTVMPTGRLDASSGRSTTGGTTSSGGTSSSDSTSGSRTGTSSSTGTSGTSGSSTGTSSTPPPR
jgi:putative membrane protein